MWLVHAWRGDRWGQLLRTAGSNGAIEIMFHLDASPILDLHDAYVRQSFTSAVIGARRIIFLVSVLVLLFSHWLVSLLPTVYGLARSSVLVLVGQLPGLPVAVQLDEDITMESFYLLSSNMLDNRMRK